MELSTSLKQVLVSRILTVGQQAMDIDWIPCRYNADIDLDALRRDPSSIGSDYRWFGRKKVAANPDLYEEGFNFPVNFRFLDNMAVCVVPNNAQNLKILGEFKPTPRYRQELAEDGTHSRQVPDGTNPPLYERLDVGQGGSMLNLDGMSNDDKLALTQALVASLQQAGVLPGAAAPVSVEAAPTPPAAPVITAPVAAAPADTAAPIVDDGGPTLEQWLRDNKKPKDYPPPGFAAKPETRTLQQIYRYIADNPQG